MANLLSNLLISALEVINPNPADTTKTVDSTVVEAPANPTKDSVNYIYSRNPFVSASGDAGSMLKLYHIPFNLDQTTQIDLDTLFFGKHTPNVDFEVSDANSGLKNLIGYVRTHFPQLDKLQRANLDHLLAMQTPIKKEGIDSASVARVNEAVSDNCLDVEGDGLYTPDSGWVIQPGHYWMFAKTSNQSVPALINLNFDRFEPYARDTVGAGPDTGNGSSNNRPDTVFVYDTKSKIPLELIAGATILGGKPGIEGGIRYGPVAIVGSYNSAKDENTATVTTPVSHTGTYGFGRTDEIDQKALGIAGELHLGRFFGGVGANFWRYSEEILEQLRKGDIVLTEDSNAKSKSRGSTKFYGGVNIPFGKVSADAYLGNDSQKGLMGGVRLRYNFNHKSKHSGAKR